MDIKEIALKVGLEVFEEHPYDEGHVVSPSGYTWIDEKLIEFATALLAEVQKQKEPVYQFRPECDNWIDCSAKFYESWRGEKRIVFTFQPSVEAIENRVAEACRELAIQHYKDSLLKDVGEPTGYISESTFSWLVSPKRRKGSWCCVDVGVSEVKRDSFPLTKPIFTESQLIAAVAKKDEEIEHLRMALADTEALEAGTAETNKKLRDQLATAEQRVAEACALTYLEDYDLTDIAERVRAGEWRKFVKEV